MRIADDEEPVAGDGLGMQPFTGDDHAATCAWVFPVRIMAAPRASA
jgi:hypothetical protein